MYRYFLTEDAEREFNRELAYSEEYWGRRHARDYAKQLQDKLTTIAKNPFAYPEYNDIAPGLRICTHKGSRIIFTVQEEQKRVVVIGFFSVYRDLSQLTGRIPE